MGSEVCIRGRGHSERYVHGGATGGAHRSTRFEGGIDAGAGMHNAKREANAGLSDRIEDLETRSGDKKDPWWDMACRAS